MGLLLLLRRPGRKEAGAPALVLALDVQLLEPCLDGLLQEAVLILIERADLLQQLQDLPSVSVEVFEKAMKQWQGDGAVPDEPES